MPSILFHVDPLMVDLVFLQSRFPDMHAIFSPTDARWSAKSK